MEQPRCELVAREGQGCAQGSGFALSVPMGQGTWLCPTGDQGGSQGQAAAWALADMSSMFTGTLCLSSYKSTGVQEGETQNSVLEMLALLRK